MEGDAERFADEAMAVTADDLPSPIVPHQTATPTIDIPPVMSSQPEYIPDNEGENQQEEGAKDADTKKDDDDDDDEEADEAKDEADEEEDAAATGSKRAARGRPSSSAPKAAKTDAGGAPGAVLRTGRVQKKVEVPVVSWEKRQVEIPAGKGTPLGDISKIVDEFEQVSGAADVFRHLHLLLFRTVGEKLKRKGNIRQFRGFVYTDRDAERALQVQRLTHHTVPQLKELCGLLRLERSGDKDALIERLLTFLEKPSADLANAARTLTPVRRKKSGKKEKAASKSPSGKSKSPSTKAKRPASKSPGKGKPAGKADAKEDEDEEDEDEDEDADEEEDGDDDDEEEEEEDDDDDDGDAYDGRKGKKGKAAATKKATPAKKATPVKKAPTPTPTPAKKATPTKTDASPAKTSSSPGKGSRTASTAAAAADDDDDDEPLAARLERARQPSDDALKKEVDRILRTGDLNQLSSKSVRAQLEAHFGVDLASKHPAIKEWIASGLNELAQSL